MAERLHCPGLLELPRDRWVKCDLGAGHLEKHSGAEAGKRYWWAGQHARVKNFINRAPQPRGETRG